MLYGVDVHDGYQAGLSFPLLARQGYTFAVVKLTEGTGYARGLGDDWVRAARAAGLIPGGYHWLKAGDGAAQARWFHAKVKESGGPDGMLIQLDCEDDAGFADILDWRDEWNRLTGGHPFLLYTGAWWWQPRGWSGTTVTPYLWHSRYLSADADTVPDDVAAFAARIPASWWQPGYGGWDQASIVQFTSKGDAGSLGNKVDLNVTKLTREQLLALTRPGVATSPGGADMAGADALWLGGLINQANWKLDGLTTIVTKLAQDSASVSAEELAAFKAAAAAGAAGQTDAIVAAVVAKLPADTMSRGEVEQALRDALAGGLVLGPDPTP